MRQRLTRKNEIVRHTRVSKVSYCAMHEKSIENESKKKNGLLLLLLFNIEYIIFHVKI